MATIGLRNLVFAEVTNDDNTGTTYGTVGPVSKSINATITPTVNSATLYAEDGADDTASAMGVINVSLQVKDLPKEVQAALLGHTVNEDGVLIKKTTDSAPYVAIGFKSLKSDGKSYRYKWLYKGKFQPQEQVYNTKGETPEFQTPTITAQFIKRTFDDQWEAEADDDDETIIDPTIFDTWFDAPYEYSAV